MSKHSETGTQKKPVVTAPPARGRPRKAKQTTATARGSGAGDSLVQINADTRHAMIAEAAYYRAEKRGFENGHEVQDWLEAEMEINLMLPNSTTH